MQYPCIESTIDLDLDNGATIRLWLNQPRLPSDTFKEAQIAWSLRSMASTWYWSEANLQMLVDSVQQACTQSSLVPNAIGLQFPRSAVGIRFGVVVYLVPFSEDVHG